MTIWAILGAFSIPLLIGIYFLRNRYPQKKVSSLLLWDFPEFKMRKGINKNKFISERSFWLELIVLLIFMTLLLQIAIPVFENKQKIVYILDNHYSLQANADGNSKVYQLIQKEILAEIKNQDSITIIIADQYPKLLAANARPDKTIIDDISNWRPNAMAFDWQLTKVMLTEISDVNTRIIIYSDRPLLNQNYFAGFELRLRGVPNDNFAFINGTYRRSNKEGIVQGLVKGNPAKEGKILPKIKATIKQNDFVEVLSIENKENLNLYPFSVRVPVGNLPVSIQLEDDELLPDNILHFEVPSNRVLNVKIDIHNKELDVLIRKTLSIFEQIKISEKEHDVLISDQLPKTINVPLLLIGMPKTFAIGESKDVFENIIMQKDFELIKDMQPQNIRWRGCMKTNAVLIPYLYATDLPIFGKLQNFEKEVFFWNADLIKSDFKQLQDWPIFWDNFKTYFMKYVAGIQYTTLMGSLENYLITDADEVEIITPSQKSIKINAMNRKVVIPPFLETGKYLVREKEKEVSAFYINYLDLEGMNLMHNKYYSGKISGDVSENKKHLSKSGNSHLLNLILLLIGVSIYCLNLFLDHREENKR